MFTLYMYHFKFLLLPLYHIVLNMSTEITQIPLSAKILFYLLPTIGLCFAFLDMAVLIRRRLNAYPIAYHEWLFSFSQFSFWVSSNFPKVMEMSKLSFLLLLWKWTFVFSLLPISGYSYTCSNVRNSVGCLVQSSPVFLVDCKIVSADPSTANSFFFTRGNSWHIPYVNFSLLFWMMEQILSSSILLWNWSASCLITEQYLLIYLFMSHEHIVDFDAWFIGNKASFSFRTFSSKPSAFTLALFYSTETTFTV